MQRTIQFTATVRSNCSIIKHIGCVALTSIPGTNVTLEMNSGDATYRQQSSELTVMRLLDLLTLNIMNFDANLSRHS